MDPDAVAKAFVEHYYRTFDNNRADLGNLYQDGSMLTFEGAKTQGSQAIVAKLTSLPFQQCLHNIFRGAACLSSLAALSSSPMFQLIPTPQGSFYVLNDIFRLNYT
ncbi:unnamed protein product [Spirodela intermedia]|uniref:NTF2 domain-containing protein n=1 Tax=Spirodela intermedia TaxID=51605 RepID=A0A7I8JG34_SPIIN|nr:unnamed protein product [Spirodela intermedia]CAA6668352.1 unnamed protein product [Spirodela intermedia]